MSDPRPSRIAWLVLTAVLLFAAVSWTFDTLQPPPESPPIPAHNVALEPAVGPSGDTVGPRTPAEPPGTDATDSAPSAAAPSADTTVLRVRLRGLHERAPWTEQIRLAIDDDNDRERDFSDRRVPDANGLCTFDAPVWTRGALALDVRIEGIDPFYEPLSFRREGSLDVSAELVLDVQVVAGFEGRVVDARGQPVPAARIAAFAVRNGTVIDGKLAEINTRDDGTFRLKAPPDTPLLLLAAPMVEMKGKRRLWYGDGAVNDLGELRADLLPAAKRSLGRAGDVTAVEDFVLADAVKLTGVVRWRDGTPVARATVRTLPAGGITLGLERETLVQLQDDGGLVPGARAHTRDDGTFVLAGAPGAQVDVQVAHLDDMPLIGFGPLQRAVPPQTLEFTLLPPIRLRVEQDGLPMPRANVAIADMQTLTTSDEGTVELVAMQPFRARASREQQRSAWVDLGPETAGTSVVLNLGERLGEISIEFEGEFRVRNTVISWQSGDGHTGRQHLLRDDNSGPFRIFLEPGSYHLEVGPGGGERNGVYLLPVERDIVVGAAPLPLVLPAVFGGTFVVYATDSSGLYVAGTCRVVDANGTDCTDRFRVQRNGGSNEGQPGELLPDGPNEFTRMLRPGHYELTFDFEGHGAFRHRVTIRPREVTDVRVRL